MALHSLRSRPKSEDFDLLNDAGEVRGQVIKSPHGYTVYLLGDFESLLEPRETAQDALDHFEDWAASNTTTSIPIIPAQDDAAQP